MSDQKITEPGAIWQWLARIGAQTALLTAALYYFGWARTDATYRYFGVDSSMLGFSTSDYLLRSVNSLYKPLLVLALVLLVGVLIADVLSESDRRGNPRPRRWALLTTVAIGAALVIAGLVSLIAASARLPVAIVLAAGVLCLRWAVDVAASGPERASHDQATTSAQLRPASALTLLVLIAGFWALSLYAAEVGEDRARKLAGGRTTTAGVTVFARAKLGLAGPGVTQRRLPATVSTEYPVRYDGFRLLIHADGRYFLLPAGWRQGRDAAFVLPDSGPLRVELRAGNRLSG